MYAPTASSSICAVLDPVWFLKPSCEAIAADGVKPVFEPASHPVGTSSPLD